MNRAACAFFLVLLSQGAVAGQPVAGEVQKTVKPQASLPASARDRIVASPTSNPFTLSALCLASKTVLVNGVHGRGCRETPRNIWGPQGCPVNIGCCGSFSVNATSTCIVRSPTNAVQGDGIY